MIRFTVGLILLFAFASPSWAQGISNCSLTASGTAAPIVFPAATTTGNPFPTSYLEICDSHASQTLGVNWIGGTAAIGSNGTVTLAAGACKKWTSLVDGVVPSVVSVIGSASSTTTTCAYR